MIFNCGVILIHYNFICILVLTILKMTTRVAKTCWWLLCNEIIFVNPSAFVGHYKKLYSSD